MSDAGDSKGSRPNPSGRILASVRFAMLVLCAAGMLSGSASARDWTAHPPILEREAPRTIFAIGDIHGDYERLIRLLHAAGITSSEAINPGEAPWAAGDSVL